MSSPSTEHPLSCRIEFAVDARDAEAIERRLRDGTDRGFAVSQLTVGGRLGSRSSSTTIEILVSFAIGVTSSIAASAIVDAFQHDDVKPANGVIVIEGDVILLGGGQAVRKIEDAIEKQRTKKVRKR